MTTPDSSQLYSDNAWFLEDLYEAYLLDPDAIPLEWQRYFDELRGSTTDAPAERAHGPVRQAFADLARTRRVAQAQHSGEHEKQVSVLQLINAYRFRGHRRAELDPLHQHDRPEVPELDPEYHGLTAADMDTVFNTGSLFGVDEAPLRDILERVQTTYCGSIGAEYMHINETAQKRWIQERLETVESTPNFDAATKREILQAVVAAGTLEEYLHKKYVGQKRFSLEGGESTIALLDRLIQSGGEQGIKEVVVGMAHRGRLNVLVNIVGKLPSDLFDEFEGKSIAVREDSHADHLDLHRPGDVKYHLGYSSDIASGGGAVHVTLAFNPSHLEIIDPVVEGSVRARQDRRGDGARNQVLPVLLHGDAAFAGQGVVMETLNLSETHGYSTGGTVHVIINNQIGFTTSDPLDSRSTLYCTDVAKMVQAPIFHVNGDDPEAVVFIAELALAYRMAFHKDVVVDVVCYRKHGHSEADEPFTTQPLMYQLIRKHPDVEEIYGAKLAEEGVIDAGTTQSIASHYVDTLEHETPVSRPHAEVDDHPHQLDFSPFLKGKWTDIVDTTVSLDRVRFLSERLTTMPENFKLHRAVAKIVDNRREIGAGNAPVDWGYAETLAYASLLQEGYPVRLSGQDCGRGTFFHRHAVVHEQNTGETFLPLQHLKDDQAKFLVINSTLSEEAVLGFEYGYSSAEPNALVIWEAQFGDFANGAQVVIDQFIASCESKWGRHCGLVMFLPHGYDGQGPEHSSARLERYLQLCAEVNMQICVPSTPAQTFHMLRRQMIRKFRRPLVVMSPKSLLRHKLSISTLEDITDGGWQNVIAEVDPIDANRVTRLIACSGKIYYDLLEARRTHAIDDIAIFRLEQQYPFPREEVQSIIDRYPKAREVVWVQEEPRNQGAWVYLLARLHLFGCLRETQELILVARPYSASPAGGYMSLHLEQQQALVDEALRLKVAGATEKKSA